MPSSKGRKKGRNRERERSSGGERPPDEMAPASKPATVPVRPVVAPRMPSPMARISGAVLAVFTAGIAVYMVMTGLADESASASIARIVGGLLMVVIAAVVGILSVAPEVVVRVFGRRE